MLSTRLDLLGRLCARRPWAVVGAWLVLALLVVAGGRAFGQPLEDSFDVPGLDSQQANDLIARADTGQAGLTAQVVLTPADGSSTFFSSAAAGAAVREVQTSAARLPHVLSTTDTAGALATGPHAAPDSGLVSRDGRVSLVGLQYPDQAMVSAADVELLKAVVARVESEHPVRIELRGQLLFAFEESQAGAGEGIGLLVAALILFLAFGSLVATILPLAMAGFGLVVGISAMSLLARVVEVPSWAPVLGAMVGLGVGIDYALFVVTRHRRSLAAGRDVVESAGHATATSGRPVVFAGGIVMVSVLGLAVAGVPFLTGGGIALAMVVAVMVAAAITLLPAMLGLVGPAIDRFGIRVPGAATGVRWERWVGHVTRHPWAYLVSGSLLLVALAAPALALRAGMPDDGTLPSDRTERAAYDLIAEGFGPGTNGPLVVAVDLAGDRAVLAPLVAGLTRDPGVASVQPPTDSPAAGIATVVVVPTTGPQDPVTAQTLERIRDDVIPAALAGSPARAHVGGQLVHFTDVGLRVNDRLPLFVGAVLVLAFLMLVLVFRSVLVPLKAVLLNLLSIAAAYGVMVMVFQWGWGGGLIGLTATVPIVSFIPMFMFAILFGLSMDYEVFLLSRVHEEYAAGAGSTGSVVRGIAGTARVITSAGLIMIAVFLAFVTGQDAATKMFGLGLATAVLLDVTVVRMVLVPAAMTLLGDANWWVPAWLDRLLPRLEVAERAPAADAAARSVPV